MADKSITVPGSIEAEPSSPHLLKSAGKWFKAQFVRGRTWGLVSILMVWQFASMVSPEDTLAPPYVVFKAAIFHVILEDGFFIHVGSTLLRIIIGFSIAFILGLVIGVMMGIRRYWEKFFSDYVTVGITIPSLAWAVIGVLWLGIHYLTPVFSAVMIATPYVMVNVWEGVKNVDKDLVDMGRAFDVSRSRIIRDIYIPSILPFVFAAVRIGFSVSWKLVVLAEVFGSSEGIGFMIFYWYENFEMALVLAWVTVFCFIMFIYEYGIVKTLERRLFAWRREVTL
jgi:NitT/TauT family transport system permease protein